MNKFQKLFCSPISAVVFLLFAGFIVYSQTFSVPFCFDDVTSIVENSCIKDSFRFSVIWKFWPTRFFTYCSFALNYFLHGLNVFGYHLFNFIIHFSNGVLVWWLFRLTFQTPVIKKETIARYMPFFSLCAALLFIVHPLQTQAVTYIVQRATSLTTFFYLFSLTFYIKWRLSENEHRDICVIRFFYIGSFVAMIMAMFTKEMAITLPLAILLYEYCFLRAERSFIWKKTLPFLIAIGIIPLTILMNFREIARICDAGPTLSAGQYFITQLKVLVTYLRLFVFPINQNLDYDYPIAQTFLEPAVVFSFVVLLTILIAAIVLFSRYPLISFGVFWFFITLFPESSFFSIQDVIFEHRLYLPMVGYIFFLMSVIFLLWEWYQKKTGAFSRQVGTGFPPMEVGRILKWSRVPWIHPWGFIVILILLLQLYGLMAYNRNSLWQNHITLYSDTVVKSPRKARPYGNLAMAYMDKGYYQDAEALFKKACALDPKYIEAYNNLSVLYGRQGQYQRAIDVLKQSIKIYPGRANTYHNLALTYFKIGRYQDAIETLNYVIHYKPDYAKAYFGLALIYLKKGDVASAKKQHAILVALDMKLAGILSNKIDSVLK